MKYQIGKRIKELRESLGLNQKEFSEKIGVSNSRVSNWEKGINRPDVDLLSQICATLKVSADELLELNTTVSLNAQEQRLVATYKNLTPNGKILLDTILNNILEYEKTQFSDAQTLKDPAPAYGENVIPIFENITLAHRSGSAGAGTGAPADNIEVVSIDYPADLVPPGTDYTINVSGDSMEPTYYDGDILFCQRTNSLDYGDIGIFILNGDTLVKEYGEDGLISHNGKYDVIKISADASLRVEGKVLGKL